MTDRPTKLDHRSQTALQFARCVRDHNADPDLLDMNWHRNLAMRHAWAFENRDREKWIYWTAVTKWLDLFMKKEVTQ